MNVLEKNNQRKRELDELINKLEIEITNLNGSLLEEDSKLDLEKQRLENLKALLSQKINYKNKGIQDFIIINIILGLAILLNFIFPIKIILLIIIAFYLIKTPKFIKLLNLLNNDELGKLEISKNEVRSRIRDYTQRKNELEKKLNNINFRLDELEVEKNILDESFNFRIEEERSKEIKRIRLREKVV